MTLFSQLVPRLRALSRPVYSGAYGDSVIGGASIRHADTLDFEGYLRHAGQDAFTPEMVQQLIRPDILRDGLDHAVEKMRQTFDSCGGDPFQRAWLCDLTMLDRMRVMFPWLMAFGSWPVLPFADRNVLETMAGMPPSSITGRRLEIEILCRRFRHLSLLPLDRNSYNTAPAFGLKRFLRQRNISGAETLKLLKNHTEARIGGPVSHYLDKQIGKDRRYYYRILDIHHAGWQKLRRRAEMARPSMERIFDPKVLWRFWPGPETTLTFQDGIRDAHKTKLFIGLALWMERNLP